jgi:hypothetical protein
MFRGADNSCPRGKTCVVGVSQAYQSRSEAITAANIDGYRQLASRAFPVEISGKIQIERHVREGSNSVSTSATEQTESRIAGRITDAKVARTEWVKRRAYSVEGSSVVYDAWSYIVIDTRTLDTLYEKQKQKSRERIRALTEEVNKSIERLDADSDIPAFRIGLESFRKATDAYDTVLDVEGLDRLKTRVDVLEQRLVTAFDVENIEQRYMPVEDRAQMGFRVNVFGAPAANLDLQGTSSCQSESLSIPTSQSGGKTDLTADLPGVFRACEIDIAPKGLPSAGQTFKAGPIVTCVDTQIGLRVTGTMGASIEKALREQLGRLIDNSLPATLTECQAGNKSRPMHLTAKLQLHLGEPSRVQGSWVKRLGGPVSLNISGGYAGGQTETIGSNETTINGMGKGRQQLQEGVLKSASDFVSKSLDHDLSAYFNDSGK